MFDRPYGAGMAGMSGRPMSIPNGFLPPVQGGGGMGGMGGGMMPPRPMGSPGGGSGSEGFMPNGRPRGRGPTNENAMSHVPPWLLQMFQQMQSPGGGAGGGGITPGGMPPPPGGTTSILPAPNLPISLGGYPAGGGGGGLTFQGGGGYQALPQPQPVPFNPQMLMMGARGMGGMRGGG